MLYKFKRIPVEQDIRILNNLQTTFNGIDCVYQFWQAKDIQGSSIVFYCDDVNLLTNKELEQWIREFPLLIEKGSSVTISRNPDSEYVIVNFNFLDI